MKNLLNLLFVAFLLLASTSCSNDSAEDLTSGIEQVMEIPQAKTIEIEVLELLNNHRISLGLNSLETIEIVKGQAFSHSDYMVETDNVSHDNFYNRRAYLINAGAKTVSENVAYGYTNAQSVVNAWLNSDGHKANIEGDFTGFEISAEQNEEGKWYYTNIFIKE